MKRDKPNWLTASIAPGSLRVGANKAVMRLAKRSVQSAMPRTVTALEFHVQRSVEEDARPPAPSSIRP